VSYEWKINNVTVATRDTFSYHFPDYGDVSVVLLLGDSAGNITTIEERFSLNPPLVFIKGPAAPSLLHV
jgi:hypothetical protein